MLRVSHACYNIAGSIIYIHGVGVTSPGKLGGVQFVLSHRSVRLFVGSKRRITAATIYAPLRTRKVQFFDSGGVCVAIRGCSVMLWGMAKKERRKHDNFKKATR